MKYWSAESSLEEERELFGMMQNKKGQDSSYFDAIRQLKGETKNQRKPVRFRTLKSLSILASAASVCLLLSIGIRFWFNPKINVSAAAETVYTQEEVMEISQDALYYVAGVLKSISSK